MRKNGNAIDHVEMTIRIRQRRSRFAGQETTGRKMLHTPGDRFLVHVRTVKSHVGIMLQQPAERPSATAAKIEHPPYVHQIDARLVELFANQIGASLADAEKLLPR